MNFYLTQSGNSSYQQEGTDIPPYSFFDAYAGQQGTGIPPEYYYNAMEIPAGGSPYQDMTDWARQQREKEKGAVPPPKGFLEQFLQKKGTNTKQAGSPSFDVETWDVDDPRVDEWMRQQGPVSPDFPSTQQILKNLEKLKAKIRPILRGV